MNDEIQHDIDIWTNKITEQIEHTRIYGLFTKVPKENHITYGTHVWRMVKRSVYFGYVAICTWLYAFFPFLMEMFPSLMNIDHLTQTYVNQSVLKPEQTDVSNESTAV